MTSEINIYRVLRKCQVYAKDKGINDFNKGVKQPFMCKHTYTEAAVYVMMYLKLTHLYVGFSISMLFNDKKKDVHKTQWLSVWKVG